MIIKSPFLASLRDVIRLKRYSLQTEKVIYIGSNISSFLMTKDIPKKR